MPLACVVGDVTTGHDSSEPTSPWRSSQNPNVSIENLKVIVVGEYLLSHNVFPNRHYPITSTGSSNVFINNKPVVRNLDRCDCGDTMTAGVQTTVFVNGRS